MIRRQLFLLCVVGISWAMCCGMSESSDVMDVEDRGYQLRRAAASGNRQKLLQLLHVGVLASSAAGDGIAPLHWAAMKNRVEIIDDLIGYGANVNCQSRMGITPLFMAAEKGKVRAIRRLLAHGARTDLTDTAGNTPLLNATGYGHIHVVRTLLQHGTQEINITDNGAGDGPLHVAMSSDNRDRNLRLVLLLLRYGADPNLINTQDGSAPLHFAASKGDIHIIWALLDNGARADRRDFNGLTPADDARRCGNPDIARLLENIARTQNS